MICGSNFQQFTHSVDNHFRVKSGMYGYDYQAPISGHCVCLTQEQASGEVHKGKDRPGVQYAAYTENCHCDKEKQIANGAQYTPEMVLPLESASVPSPVNNIVQNEQCDYGNAYPLMNGVPYYAIGKGKQHKNSHGEINSEFYRY
jgi:hypothetical protein